MSRKYLNRSLFLEPMADEAGLGLLMRTAGRFGYSTLHKLFCHICPELSGRIPFSSQEGQLTMLCRWVGPMLGLSCDEVLRRFSDISLHHLFVRDLMHVERVTIGAAQKPDRVFHRWLAVLGAGPFRAQYCRECAAEQYGEEGFTTWLRSHNLPHVHVCANHGCWLDALEFTAYQFSLPPAQTAAPELVDTLGAPQSRDLELARLLRDLLQADLPWIGHDLRAKLFRQRLHQVESDPASSEDMGALYDILSDPTAQRFFMPGLKAAVPDLGHALLAIQALYGGSDRFISAVRSAVTRPDRAVLCEGAPQDLHYFSVRPVHS